MPTPSLREDGNENCGVTHGVVLYGNATRLLWARQVGVKAIRPEVCQRSRLHVYRDVVLLGPRATRSSVTPFCPIVRHEPTRDAGEVAVEDLALR